MTHWLTDCGTVEWLLPIYTAHYFSYCCMFSPKAHLLLHMDEVSAVVISRVKGRGEEVTWFAYTKPKFTAMASAEEKHWEAFANRTRNSTAPSAEGGARRRTTVCATAQHHRMRNSTGGTVEGARSEGKVEWPFKKETQNGLLTCSQCGGYIDSANHKWMPHRDLDGQGPCRYHCNVTKTGAKKRSVSWDSSFSSTPCPS